MNALLATLVLLPSLLQHGMFDENHKIVGGLDTLRCDELEEFDKRLGPGEVDFVLGAYGFGYITAGILEVATWLEADPTTPDEQAQAKALRDKFTATDVSVGIAAASIRTSCSTPKEYPNRTVLDAIKILLRKSRS